MNDYQIVIMDLDSPEYMFDIQEALHAYGVEGTDTDGVGMYLRHGYEQSVFVAESDVEKAVYVINSLGFWTDEN